MLILGLHQTSTFGDNRLAICDYQERIRAHQWREGVRACNVDLFGLCALVTIYRGRVRMCPLPRAEVLAYFQFTHQKNDAVNDYSKNVCVVFSGQTCTLT